MTSAQYLSDLSGAGARTDADDDGAAALDCDEQHVDGGGVAVPHRDAIATRHTETGELLSQSGCRGVEFAPGQRHAGMVDVGRTLW